MLTSGIAEGLFWFWDLDTKLSWLVINFGIETFVVFESVVHDSVPLESLSEELCMHIEQSGREQELPLELPELESESELELEELPLLVAFESDELQEDDSAWDVVLNSEPLVLDLSVVSWLFVIFLN